MIFWIKSMIWKKHWQITINISKHCGLGVTYMSPDLANHRASGSSLLARPLKPQLSSIHPHLRVLVKLIFKVRRVYGGADKACVVDVNCKWWVSFSVVSGLRLFIDKWKIKLKAKRCRAFLQGRQTFITTDCIYFTSTDSRPIHCQVQPMQSPPTPSSPAPPAWSSRGMTAHWCLCHSRDCFATFLTIMSSKMNLQQPRFASFHRKNLISLCICFCRIDQENASELCLSEKNSSNRSL